MVGNNTKEIETLNTNNLISKDNNYSRNSKLKERR